MDDPTLLIVTSGQVGSMADAKCLTRGEDAQPRKQFPYRSFALALWAFAFMLTGLCAEYAFDRVRILILFAGMLMIDIACALLVSLLWYLDDHLGEPVPLLRAAGEYIYRAGWRDHEAEQRKWPGLHVVPPAGGYRVNGQRSADDTPRSHYAN